MFNVGFGEFIVFAIIALLVLGPEQLPKAIYRVIQFYRQFKKLLNQVQHDFEKELQLSELQHLMQRELEQIKLKEDEMQKQLAQLHQEIAALNAIPQQKKSIVSPCQYISFYPLSEQEKLLNYKRLSPKNPYVLSKQKIVEHEGIN